MSNYKFNEMIYTDINELLDMIAEEIDINKIVQNLFDEEDYQNDILQETLDDIKNELVSSTDGDIFKNYGLKIECIENDDEDIYYNFNKKTYLDIEDLLDDIEKEIDMDEVISLRLQDEDYKYDIFKETLDDIEYEIESLTDGEIFEEYGVKIECIDDDDDDLLDDTENEINDIEYELKSLINLSDAKELAIGERFIFGTYGNEPIEWRKINENLAISEKILDCIIFDTNSGTTYDESKLRKWCNNTLGKSLGVSEDTVYELSYEEMLNYFPTDESRQAKPTEWAIMHGIYVDKDGYSSYWTSSLKPCPVGEDYYSCTRIVNNLGLFWSWGTNYSNFGVRPALKLD